MPDGFCRVVVTTAPDSERAQATIRALCAGDKEREAASAGGRPSRRRGTIAQLVARRDKALDREIAEIIEARSKGDNVLVYKGRANTEVRGTVANGNGR